MGFILGTLISKKKYSSSEVLVDYNLDLSESEIFEMKNIFFVGKSTDIVKKDKSDIIYYDRENDCCIIANTRLDYKYDLMQQLGITSSQSVSDSQLILLSYIKWGYECLKYLFGDFAFGIYDFKKDQLFCARDHFGLIPFIYHKSSQQFVFSTHFRLIKENTSVPVKLSDSWISDCLTLVSPEFTASPFCEIKKLPPAHSLIFKDGKIILHRYWTLKTNKIFAKHKELEAIQTFNEKLYKAIESRISTNDKIGIELSGGLDSSGLAAIASKICYTTENEILAFSHVLSKNAQGSLFPFSDEAKYSTLVSKYTDIKKHCLIDGNDIGIIDAIKNSLETILYPVSQGYAMLSDQLYSEALRRGVTVIFSGFGGDEGVTSSAPGYFHELAHMKSWNILKYEMSLKHIRWKERFIKLYVYHLLIESFPKLYQKLKATRQKSNNTSLMYNMFGLDKDFEKTQGSKKRFSENVGFPRDHDVKKRQFKRLNSSYLTLRLENSFYTTEKYGITYRYPLLDVKLIEYYFSLSSNLKYRNGFGRYIYRKVLENYLPEEICWRNEKSKSPIPSVQERFMKDVEKITELINESEKVNNYHYIDYHDLKLMIQKVISRNQGKNLNFAPIILFNHLQILILQKWQREGKIDIGIKC